MDEPFGPPQPAPSPPAPRLLDRRRRRLLRPVGHERRLEGRRSHRRRPARQRRRRAASARVVAAPAAKSAAPGSAPAPILVPDFRLQHHQLFRPGFDLTVDGAEAAEPAADAELVDEPVAAGE